MKKLGIFYGTSTGNTEYVAKLLVKGFGDYDVHLADIARVKNVQLLEDFDYLILASSTWNFGDLQDDWMDRKAVLEGLNLKGKKVALLGLGDASAYRSEERRVGKEGRSRWCRSLQRKKEEERCMKWRVNVQMW